MTRKKNRRSAPLKRAEITLSKAKVVLAVLSHFQQLDDQTLESPKAQELIAGATELIPENFRPSNNYNRENKNGANKNTTPLNKRPITNARAKNKTKEADGSSSSPNESSEPDKKSESTAQPSQKRNPVARAAGIFITIGSLLTAYETIFHHVFR
jgi:hypothetical protein